MASSENFYMSELSHVYICRKQEFKVSQMIILYKSKNWLTKWSVCGETGEFSRRKGSDRSINLCFGSTTGNDVMIAL